MFEIPDDDDLFSEANLEDILADGSCSPAQQHQEKASGTNSCISWKIEDHAPPSSSTAVDVYSGLPSSKRMRVLSDVNHQKDTAKPTCGETAVSKVNAVNKVTDCHHSVQHHSSHRALPTHGLGTGASETVKKRSLRKFPGPAGILPPAKYSELASVVRKNLGGSPEVVANDESNKPEEEVCSSPLGLEVFEGTAWQALLTDLEPTVEDVLKKFSVCAMLHKASRRLLPKGKIPLLLGVLDSIDFQGTDASVVLKDRTGQMQGTLHREVLKDFSADLQAGAAVVLRQVSVISPSARTHYLNITAGNIVAIYPRNGSRGQWIPTLVENQETHLTGPSSQSVKSLVHTAEIELLEAANAAKLAALKKQRRPGPCSPNSPLETVGSRLCQGGGLFSSKPFQPPRNNSPSSFHSHRPEPCRSPATSTGGRNTFQNSYNLSQLRTPTSHSRIPIPGINPTAGGQSPHVQNFVVNNTRFSDRQNVMGHPLTSVADGKGGLRSSSSQGACADFSGQSETAMCRTADVSVKESHSEKVKTLVPQADLRPSQPSQESKWSFKRKSAPLPSFVGSSSETSGEGRELPVKVQEINSNSSAQWSVRLGQTVASAACVKSTVEKRSNLMWEEELDDNILSQLSDDF